MYEGSSLFYNSSLESLCPKKESMVMIIKYGSRNPPRAGTNPTYIVATRELESKSSLIFSINLCFYKILETSPRYKLFFIKCYKRHTTRESNISQTPKFTRSYCNIFIRGYEGSVSSISTTQYLGLLIPTPCIYSLPIFHINTQGIFFERQNMPLELILEKVLIARPNYLLRK